jgi:SAM-dependent methyltransferase
VDIEEIAQWYFAGRPRLLSDPAAIEAFHLFGPRVRYLKTLPLGCSVLDVGAGQGALHIYRQWPGFARGDLRLFAYAADPGPNFEHYDASEIGMWPEAPPRFGAQPFGAIMACNFIEHIDDPLAFVRWACGRLAPGSLLYLEWPRLESIALPSTAALRERGINVMVGSYFDDGSHRQDMPRVEDVQREMIAAGLSVEVWGVVRVPFIDGELVSAARAANDLVGATLAYWSFTGWCQYLIGRCA